MNDNNVFDQLKSEISKYDRMMLADYFRECSQKGMQVIAGSDICLYEVAAAMGLPYCVMTTVGGAGTQIPGAAERIDLAKDMEFGSKLCTCVRLAMYYLETGQLPVPAALITFNTPCDAVTTLGEMARNYKPWANVPKFVMDASYSKDDEGMEYFARQMKQAVSFLEEATGKKLDKDRLDQVCEEANKQCRLLLDFQELKKAVPCPVTWTWARDGFRLARWMFCGDPWVTDWLERLIAATEQRVKEKKGVDGINEKIRYMVWDPAMVSPTRGDYISNRLAKELGAMNMMDYYSFACWTPIDLSSEDAMYMSFAKRHLNETGMSRQAMDTSFAFAEDVARIARDFKCDAIVMTGHIGHKEQDALHEIVRDHCRKQGMPLLIIGCDIWDERVMSLDVVYDKIKTFFEVSGFLDR